MTKVSIVICTRNRANFLRQTLESLSRLEIPLNHSVELIVVDNASTDETADAIQTAHLPNLTLRHLYEARPGQSQGVNSGTAVAQGEIILWTDDDVRLPANWIAEMCGPIEKGEADMTAGEVQIAPHLERVWMKPIHWSWLADTRALPKERLPFGANMAFHRRVLKSVPGLDTELGPGVYIGSGADVLFSLQLRQVGFKILAVASLVEHHFEPSRLLYRAWKKRAWIEGRIEAYYCYHWLHRTVAFASLRALYKRLQLALYRFFHSRVADSQEGCPVEEIYLIKYLEFFRGYAREAKRPRNYELKGLIRAH